MKPSRCFGLPSVRYDLGSLCGVGKLLQVWFLADRVLNDAVVVCHILFPNDLRQQTARWFNVCNFCDIADNHPRALHTICQYVSNLL